MSAAPKLWRIFPALALFHERDAPAFLEPFAERQSPEHPFAPHGEGLLAIDFNRKKTLCVSFGNIALFNEAAPSRLLNFFQRLAPAGPGFAPAGANRSERAQFDPAEQIRKAPAESIFPDPSPFLSERRALPPRTDDFHFTPLGWEHRHFSFMRNTSANELLAKALRCAAENGHLRASDLALWIDFAAPIGIDPKEGDFSIELGRARSGFEREILRASLPNPAPTELGALAL